MGTYTASYNRVTGVRVQRSASRWWTFPLCQPCVDWVNASQVADEADAEARRAKGAVGEVRTLSLLLMVCGLAAATCCGMTALLSAVGGERSVACYGLILPPAGLAVAAYGFHLRTTVPGMRRRARRLRQNADDAQADAGTARPEGAAALPPVELGDWYGSVWSFTFANEVYARWLALANHAKLVR